MKKSLIIVGVAVALFILGTTLYAQENKSSITIDITKEIDGERKNFSKSYSSQEEMENDEDLKAFNQSGSQTQTVIVAPNNQHMKVHHGDSTKAYVFDFDSEVSRAIKRLKGSGPADEDSLSIKLNSQIRKLEDALARLGMSIGEEIQVLDEMDWDEIKERHKIVVIDNKRDDEKGPAISFEEVEEKDFGKKGIVKEAELLVLDDLRIERINHSSARFILGFSHQETTNLRIAIYDERGDELLIRSQSEFSGGFSEVIDLNGQAKGKYLLEINLGKKRLVRKVIIK